MSQLKQELACERLPDCAAYVLGALEELEATGHCRHLATCAICSMEVQQLQLAADSLALGVPRASPSRGLRVRVMATVLEEAEQPAVNGQDAGRTVPARPPWSRRLVPALAIVAALGVGLAVGALALKGGSSEPTEVIRAAVLTPGRRASAELRKVGSQLELVVVDMPSPPSGRIYEVWLEHGAAAPEPTDALFSVTKAGSGAVGVPGNLGGISKVLVTAEPLGGSLKPTRTPVIVGSV